MALAFISALSLCLLNAGAAFIVILKAYKGEKENFTKLVLGSMVARYLIVAVLVWFCLKIINLDEFLFSLTFLIATFLLILAEILYLNHRSNTLNLHNHLTK
jgi:hypothetical protein